MKKRILALNMLIMLSAFMTISFVSPFLGQSKTYKKEDVKTNNVQNQMSTTEKPIIHQFIGFVQVLDNAKLEELEIETSTTTITYPDLYTDFTQEEIYMIQRCVETETYTADVISKMNVASVIFNRLNHPDNKYGDDVVEIITAPNQFAYGRTEISKETVQAIENVYKYGDTTNGCIAYRSDEHPQYWYGWELQFVDSVNHGFYKEITEKGDK